MTEHNDPVDLVMLAFLDYLEGTGPRPSLDPLSPGDRARAQRLIDSLEAGRGIDPHASRPSLEALLAGTRLAGLLPGARTARQGVPDPTTVQDLLAGVDHRVGVSIDSDLIDRVTIVYSYLDLRARFLLVDADAPTITEQIRTVVETIFDRDPDSSHVGVVATRSDYLPTQMLSANDVGHTITTPRGERHVNWEPVQDLELAARHLLEQCAPEWDLFDFGHSPSIEIFDLAADLAQKIIARESSRSFRGDKARAYRSLIGSERVFSNLIAKVSAPGSNVIDLDAEIDAITRAAA